MTQRMLWATSVTLFGVYSRKKTGSRKILSSRVQDCTLDGYLIHKMN
jgi:hypothetical protein